MLGEAEGNGKDHVLDAFQLSRLSFQCFSLTTTDVGPHLIPVPPWTHLAPIQPMEKQNWKVPLLPTPDGYKWQKLRGHSIRTSYAWEYCKECSSTPLSDLGSGNISHQCPSLFSIHWVMRIQRKAVALIVKESQGCLCSAYQHLGRDSFFFGHTGKNDKV